MIFVEGIFVLKKLLTKPNQINKDSNITTEN